MSLKNDIVISILDNEISDSYADTLRSQINADSNLRKQLHTHTHIKKIIQNDNTAQAERYSQSAQTLKHRVVQTIQNKKIEEEERSTRRSAFFRFIPAFSRTASTRLGFRFIRYIPAFSALLVVFFFGFFLSTRMFSSTQSSQFQTITPNYSVIQELDLAPSTDSTFPANLSESGRSTALPFQRLPDPAQSQALDLRIELNSMEELLYLLDQTRRSTSSINSLTIELPEIENFEILGESQLRSTGDNF